MCSCVHEALWTNRSIILISDWRVRGGRNGSSEKPGFGLSSACRYVVLGRGRVSIADGLRLASMCAAAPPDSCRKQKRLLRCLLLSSAEWLEPSPLAQAKRSRGSPARRLRQAPRNPVGARAPVGLLQVSQALFHSKEGGDVVQNKWQLPHSSILKAIWKLC